MNVQSLSFSRGSLRWVTHISLVLALLFIGISAVWAGGSPEWAGPTLPEIPDADVIVVNPPRSGLSKPVRARLRDLGRQRAAVRLAYISCDPATLARDIKALEHFELESVRGYDLFPQTSHVETLACLRRRS